MSYTVKFDGSYKLIVKFHNFRKWPNWTGHDRGESYVVVQMCVHVVSRVTVWDSVSVRHRQASLLYVANWMPLRRGEFLTQ